ncbi:MAG: SurA N-terminal domain-containing protein [Blastocatellia bacterium]|nr:SurA N-terminal domain-containing protein [Blastocatellia bacterium]
MINKVLLALTFIFLFSIKVVAQPILVDQLVATVNNEAITQSDIVWALALNPEVANSSSLSENLSLMLEQIIDQRLLLSEANRLPNLEFDKAEISQAITQLVKKFPNEEMFYQRLEKVGLTAEVLQQIFRDRLLILKYIDFRFRAFALVSELEIQQYYDEKVKPKLSEGKFSPPEKPSDEERKLIEAILVEERVSRQIEQFLETARQQADIVKIADLTNLKLTILE